MNIYMIVAVYIDRSCIHDKEYPMKAFYTEKDAKEYVEKFDLFERKVKSHVTEVGKRYDINTNTFQSSFLYNRDFPDYISIDLIQLY